MASKPLTVEQVLTLLAATPQRLAAATSGLTAAQLRTAPDHDGWSLNDVLAHLRSCADMWGGSIATIIAEDRPAIRAVNPRTWITRTDYPGLEFRTSLRSYSAQRAELLAVLESLPRAGWSRSATVTGAGAVLERTVLSYAQWLARHERSHIGQIERIAGALHAERRHAHRGHARRRLPPLDHGQASSERNSRT